MRDRKTAKSHLAGQERAFTSQLHIFNWSKFKIQDIMSKHVVTAHRNEALQSVAKKMADNCVSCVVIEDNDQVCGIITQTDLVAYVSEHASNNISEIPNSLASECMKSPIQTVAPEFPILHACLLMSNQNIKRLPIISDNKLVGLVSQTDMIRALESLSALRNVESIMTTNVGTISAQKTALDAMNIMKSLGISSVVVMHQEHPAGVITQKDIVDIVVAKAQDPGKMSVVDIMSFPVVSISPNQSILSASKIMDDKQIHRLIVCDDNGCCGIITRTDILNALHDKAQQEVTRNLHLMTSSSEAIYMVDNNHKTTYVNPTLLALFETDSPTHFLGQPFPPDKLWINPEDKQKLVDQRQGENFTSSRLQLQTLKGKPLFLALCSSVVKEHDGTIIGQQGVIWNHLDTPSHVKESSVSAKTLNHVDSIQDGIDEIRTWLETRVHDSQNVEEQEEADTKDSLNSLDQLTRQCRDIVEEILTTLKNDDSCQGSD